LKKNLTALLIVDMVNEFVDPEGKLCVAGARETVPRLAAVLEAFRRAGQPIIHVVREHQPDGSDVESIRRETFKGLNGFCLPGSWGAQVVAPLAPRPGEIVIAKHGWSAFFDTDLHRQLRRLGVKELFVAGTQTPNCVRATLYDATALGYEVTLLSDGTSSATPEVQESNLRDLAAMGIPIVECAEAIKGAQAAQLAERPPQAFLRTILPAEQGRVTRKIIQTIRQADRRLDRVMRIPLLNWIARRILHNRYHRRSHASVLEVDGAQAGFLVTRPVGDTMRIEAIGVFPAFRRRGWGQWLLDRAEEEARRLGLARLDLEVSAGNKMALALYWQAGFYPLPRRRGILRMERNLDTAEESE
jgi:nicotinamidase-related amidase/ribosomal protein S18 acetylase RimI-like enzyme